MWVTTYMKLWPLSLFCSNKTNSVFQLYLLRIVVETVDPWDNYKQFLFIFALLFNYKVKEILWQKAVNRELMTVGNYLWPFRTSSLVKRQFLNSGDKELKYFTLLKWYILPQYSHNMCTLLCLWSTARCVWLPSSQKLCLPHRSSVCSRSSRKTSIRYAVNFLKHIGISISNLPADSCHSKLSPAICQRPTQRLSDLIRNFQVACASLLTMWYLHISRTMEITFLHLFPFHGSSQFPHIWVTANLFTHSSLPTGTTSAIWRVPAALVSWRKAKN